jgi:hypothetical protein
MTNIKIPNPVFRRLRGYAFDPSLSIQVDTAMVNETVFKIRWESTRDGFKPGPVGEYVEVIDHDPASKCFYEPVDLNHETILAMDGLAPAESNPQFHQQMVYAIAMTTIQNFERALGRRALWASQKRDDDGNAIDPKFVQQLRIYPHAMREANAYYSPAKVALLFGYFPASNDAPDKHIPGGTVFTCLSHDIIAHETTHALLDGMHERFIEANHPDSLAFHEAFADIVALFQHFTFPEVLRHQIAKTRGNLADQNILGELAQEFGQAVGNYGALRNAIGQYNEKNEWKLLKPNPEDYLTEMEPHARGAILVATIFDAFLTIYKTRVADLLRIASTGTGVLPEGEIHPDLVNRLAAEAAKVAQHVLGMCIRALDYLPPVDITFGDYLRAIITGDIDLVPDDVRSYRIAFIEAFRRRGIYPRDIRSLSVESLMWQKLEPQEKGRELLTYLTRDRRDEARDEGELDNAASIGRTKVIVEEFREFIYKLDYARGRKDIFLMTREAQDSIHGLIRDKILGDKTDRDLFEDLTQMVFGVEEGKEIDGLEKDPKEDRFYKFEVSSLRGARRTGPNDRLVNQIIVSLTQTREVDVVKSKPGEGEQEDEVEIGKVRIGSEKETPEKEKLIFRGGCTLVLNLEDLTIRYVIPKLITDDKRLQRHREYHQMPFGQSLRATYFGAPNNRTIAEPFALLHRT